MSTESEIAAVLANPQAAIDAAMAAVGAAEARRTYEAQWDAENLFLILDDATGYDWVEPGNGRPLYELCVERYRAYQDDPSDEMDRFKSNNKGAAA